ncbi:pilus assembly protein [bacterium]|nr:pilus assembly protein [bacterium]
MYLNVTALKDSPKAHLRRRLRQVAMTKGSDSAGMPQDVRADILKETPPLERLLNRVPLFCRLDSRLDRSGLTVTMTSFVSIVIGLGLGGFIICFIFTRNIYMSIAAGILLLLVPFFYMEYKKREREEKFTELFPDALTMISRSLRSGHSFTSAIELVGTEVSAPVGPLFKTAYDQQLLGLRINDTLNNLNNRIDSLDLRFFTTASDINREVGGNFAEILDKLAATIQERIKIRRQLRVHTAQGRMTGYILAVMPIAAFFLMNFMIPGYQKRLLENDTGQTLLIFAVIMQIVGFFVIRRIINIRI